MRLYLKKSINKSLQTHLHIQIYKIQDIWNKNENIFVSYYLVHGRVFVQHTELDGRQWIAQYQFRLSLTGWQTVLIREHGCFHTKFHRRDLMLT